MPCRRFALPFVLGVVLAELVALYPGVFLRGEVISDAALAYGMPPWRGHRPANERPLRGNPTLSDDLFLFTPWDQVTRGAIASGAAPLWNPDAGCGMPLLANNQSAILAPTQSLRWGWDSPLAHTLGLLAKPLIAAAGMFLLLSRWRLGSAAAALGAIAYQGSAAMTVWLMFPLSETMAWFPWLLLGASASLGVGAASSLWGVPVAAVGGAAVLLAGHLPTAAQLVAAAGCGLAALVAVRRDVRARLPRLAGAGVIAAMLAAPQILPTVRYLTGSEAQTLRAGERPAAAQHLAPAAVWSWLVPRGFGSPEREGYAGPLNFNEAVASVGVAPLLLAALAFVGTPRRRELGLAALFIASLAASYGAPPLPWLLSHTPVLRLAAGQRFVVVAQWAACVLAACGLEALPGIPRRRLAWAGVLGGAVLLTLASLHPALHLPTGNAGSGFVARDVLAAAGAAILACVAVVLAAAGRRGIAFGLLLAETCASGLLLARGFNPTVPQAALPGPNTVTRRLDTERGDGRVAPVGWVLRPNSGTLAALPTVTGFDDVRSRRLVAYTAAANLAGAPPERIGGNTLIRRAAATLLVADRPIAGPGVTALQGFPIAGMWAARVSGAHPFAAWYPRALPATSEAEALERLAASTPLEDGAVVVENAANPLPNGPGSFRILAYERAAPTTIAVRCNEGASGVVVVRESADAGWHMTLDARPHTVVVVDGLFLGALVGPGPHVLLFTYRPAELTLGVVLAALGGVALLATGAVLLRRRWAADVSFGRETPVKNRTRR